MPAFLPAFHSIMGNDVMKGCDQEGAKMVSQNKLPALVLKGDFRSREDEGVHVSVGQGTEEVCNGFHG